MKIALRDAAHIAFSGLLLMVLTACGGGGGGAVGGVGSAMQSSLTVQNMESVPAPAEPFSIDPTALGASSGGNTYAGTYTETPNTGTTMFDGQEANSSTISLTITENGSPIVTEIETAYYLENPYQPLGLTLSYNGAQSNLLYNSINPLPSTLTVGSSGPLGTGTYYAVNSNNAIGSLTETYSVTVTSTGSFVLLNTHVTGTVNGQSISQTISYAVNNGEAVGVASVATLVNGATMNFNSACNGCWDY